MIFFLKKEFREAIKKYNLNSYDKAKFRTLKELMHKKELKFDNLFYLKTKNKKESETISYFNNIIIDNETERIFDEKAFSIVTDAIAPQIFGYENIKKAMALFLLSNENMHILLLGDPGTGKTEFLKSIEELYPNTSFGLGSGVSKAGLTAVMTKDGLVYGLLPLANNGICLIDELNLIKKEDLGGLYNAMEKGYILYTKGRINKKIDAKIRVVATANPKNDSFSEGKLKEQIPFNDALLSRFNLIFIMRKPDQESFKKITMHYLDSSGADFEKEICSKYDLDYNLIKSIGLKNMIQHYIQKKENEKVVISKDIKEKIAEYLSELRENETHLVINVTPRITRGIVGFLSAMSRYRKKPVDEAMFEEIKKIFETAFR